MRWVFASSVVLLPQRTTRGSREQERMGSRAASPHAASDRRVDQQALRRTLSSPLAAARTTTLEVAPRRRSVLQRRAAAAEARACNAAAAGLARCAARHEAAERMLVVWCVCRADCGCMDKQHCRSHAHLTTCISAILVVASLRGATSFLRRRASGKNSLRAAQGSVAAAPSRRKKHKTPRTPPLLALSKSPQ